MGGAERPGGAWLRPLLASGLLMVALAACCPAASPPRTAFAARLRALGGGEALAQLADGRQVTLSGLSAVPAGPVYVTGRLMPDGRVAVSSVQPLPPRAGGG